MEDTDTATESTPDTPCPCTSGASYDECCGPILRGDRAAATAEALMRARYTAYAQGEIDFIVDSHDPETADEVDREASGNWSRKAEWLGMEIASSEDGGADDERGVVEFIARYRLEGADLAHHERAQFRRRHGQWFYVDGEMVKSKPVVREQPKVGRNEPCPCGSGRKYKKCCQA